MPSLHLYYQQALWNVVCGVFHVTFPSRPHIWLIFMSVSCLLAKKLFADYKWSWLRSPYILPTWVWKSLTMTQIQITITAWWLCQPRTYWTPNLFLCQTLCSYKVITVIHFFRNAVGDVRCRGLPPCLNPPTNANFKDGSRKSNAMQKRGAAPASSMETRKSSVPCLYERQPDSRTVEQLKFITCFYTTVALFNYYYLCGYGSHR